MNKIKLLIVICLLNVILLPNLNAQVIDKELKNLLDESTDSISHNSDSITLISYEVALKQWKTVHDVNSWIKENFRYDMSRAMKLAENNPEKEKTDIFLPSELFQFKKGVCIDLSRFAVETLNSIDSTKHAQYLMIEFEPIVIENQVIRKHWMAIYFDSAGYNFFADSKRPGYLAGPYSEIEDFIIEYQNYRGRKILSWKVLPSFQKKKMQKVTRQKKNSLN